MKRKHIRPCHSFIDQSKKRNYFSQSLFIRKCIVSIHNGTVCSSKKAVQRLSKMHLYTESFLNWLILLYGCLVNAEMFATVAILSDPVA